MTATTPPVERVKVEQVDRQRAAEWRLDAIDADMTVSDFADLVESFARHRIGTAQASAAEIARLEKERDEALLRATVADGLVERVKAQRNAAEAESARLREALEPFAKAAPHMSRGDNPIYEVRGADGECNIRVEHFERVRTALAGGSKQEVVG